MNTAFAFLGSGSNDYFPTEGLISLYNPAHPNGRTGARINDLYGSADLDITGTYEVLDDNAVYFFTGSYASTSTELSSDLEGTGSIFSVVMSTKLHGSGSQVFQQGYGGRWKIGASGRSSFGSSVFEMEGLGSAFHKVGIGTTSGIYYPTYYKYQESEPTFSGPKTMCYGWHSGTQDPPVQRSSSFVAYTKADQNASYTKPATNLTTHGNGFFSNGAYIGGSYKTSVGITTWGGVSVGDSFIIDSSDSSIPDVLETNLTNSYLTINPDYSGFGEYYGKKIFAFKGFAVYNRVLTRTEAFSINSWFNEYY